MQGLSSGRSDATVQCCNPTSKTVLFTRTLTKTQGDFTGFQWQRWTSWTVLFSTCVFFFSLFLFSPSSSSPVLLPSFFLSEHLLRRFTLAVVDGIKKKSKQGERAMLVIQVRCVVFQWGSLAWLSYSGDGCGFWKWRCIGGDHSASGPTLLCHRDPPVGEGSEGHSRGSHWKAT